MCAQAHFDIAQALAPGKLREGHTEKPVGAGEPLHITIAIALANQTSKGVPRQVLHELREDKVTLMHGGGPLRVEAASLTQPTLKSVTLRKRAKSHPNQ